MTLAHRHEARGEKGPGAASSGVSPDRTVLALLRTGTRRCRLAAAILTIVVGLVGQTANVAYAQAREDVLYLDAPAVSKERASRAGEVTDAYSTAGVSAPPGYAREAFDSVTAPDGAGVEGVTAEAALRAGEEMLAQLEGSPSEDEDGGEDGDAELADAGSVRPHLGEKTKPGAGQVSGTAAVDGPVAQPAPGKDDDAGVQDHTPAEGPSGGAGLAIPTPSTGSGEEEQEDPPREAAPNELASAAPSDTEGDPQDAAAPTAPKPDHGTDEEPYGPAGPTSDTGPDTGGAPVEQPASEPAAGDTSEESGSGGSGSWEENPEAPAPAPAGPAQGADTGPMAGEGDGIAVVPVTSEAPAGGVDGPRQSTGDHPSRAAEQPPADEGRPAGKADEPGKGDAARPEDTDPGSGDGSAGAKKPQDQRDSEGSTDQPRAKRQDGADEDRSLEKREPPHQPQEPQQQQKDTEPRAALVPDAAPVTDAVLENGAEQPAENKSPVPKPRPAPTPPPQQEKEQPSVNPRGTPRQEPVSKESSPQLNPGVAPAPEPKPGAAPKPEATPKAVPAPEAPPAPAPKPEPAGRQDGDIEQNTVFQSGSPEAGKPGSNIGGQANQDNSIIVNGVPYEDNSLSVVNDRVIQHSSPALDDLVPVSEDEVGGGPGPLPGVVDVYEIVESTIDNALPGFDGEVVVLSKPTSPKPVAPEPVVQVSELEPVTASEPMESEPVARTSADGGGGDSSSNVQVSQVSTSKNEKK